jgi:hypothetical protein
MRHTNKMTAKSTVIPIDYIISETLNDYQVSGVPPEADQRRRRLENGQSNRKKDPILRSL